MNAAVIVAGGSGERSGLAGGKQLASIAGEPVLAHTLRAVAGCGLIDHIVVVAHPDRVAEYRQTAVAPVAPQQPVEIVGGGATRQLSVAAGLAAVPSDAELIAVHDGARPLITPDVITDAIEALGADPTVDGVVVGHPAYDTIKVVDADGRVMRTADRATLWIAQTPQVFRASALRRAYASAAAGGLEGTDDAALVEAAGGTVLMVPGPRDNIKVTVPEDLALVERALAERGRVRG